MKSYHRTFHSEFPVHDFTMTYKKSFKPMNSQYGTLSDCEFTMKSHGHRHAAVSRACSMRLLYRTHATKCAALDSVMRHSGSQKASDACARARYCRKGTPPSMTPPHNAPRPRRRTCEEEGRVVRSRRCTGRRGGCARQLMHTRR